MISVRSVANNIMQSEYSVRSAKLLSEIHRAYKTTMCTIKIFMGGAGVVTPSSSPPHE